MTQADLLLRAVLLDPDDDLARLAWADALEEEGLGERAQFVRRSVRERPKRRTTYACFGGEWGALSGHDHLNRSGDPIASWLLDGLPRQERLTVAVRRGLLDQIRCGLVAWLRHGPAICARWPITRLWLTDTCAAQEGQGWVWRSGPEVEAWLNGGWSLHAASVPGDVLGAGPAGLYNKAFPTAVEATAALSRACLNWARGRSGLPPLDRPADS